MSKIALLTDEVSNKIAAGEVVERPASVVKELIENSLDAGASKIQVRVERAGSRLIAVSDDGEGMDPDDALLCFEAHATSKIRTAEDILHIHSFGFRGEAMPSIAAVSHVTLKTRRRESTEGVCVTLDGGTFRDSVPAGCAPGTEISVRDLFYNVPARRKFLKSQSTEERWILDTVSVISLAHPDVSFELVCDGRTMLKSPVCEKLLPRISDVFGRELADAMLPVQYEKDNIKISGFVAKRGVTRPSRHEQKTFVNGRPVESPAVYRGIRDGCGPILEKGRVQPAVLFLEIPPELVDVNVHPAKREVRFRNEFEVSDAIREAVSAAMRADSDAENPFLRTEPPSPYQKPGPDPFLQEQAELQRNNEPVSSGEPKEPSIDFLTVLRQSFVNYAPVSTSEPNQPSPLFERITEDSKPASECREEERPFNGAREEPAPFPSVSLPVKNFPNPETLEILGILEDTYIVAKLNSGLILIDQHAAHERVLYERLLKGVDGVFSQKLLIPITLDLSKTDCHLAFSSEKLLEKLGFSIASFGGNTVKLEAIPAAMPQEHAGEMFCNLLAKIREEGSSGQHTDLALIARAACKAAVKAHDVLTESECRSLLRQMSECELPYCCPHGRPTVIHIPLREIQRRFGRIL